MLILFHALHLLLVVNAVGVVGMECIVEIIVHVIFITECGKGDEMHFVERWLNFDYMMQVVEILFSEVGFFFEFVDVLVWRVRWSHLLFHRVKPYLWHCVFRKLITHLECLIGNNVLV